MKVSIIHLSDFHISEGDRFLDIKINGILSSLNVLGKIDDYAIVFSGDLANTGSVNEYKSSRRIFGKLISGIKEKNNHKFVDLMLIPGNHDLHLQPNARDRKYIQECYENNTIESILPNEIDSLDNFYMYSHANGRVPYDKILSRYFRTYGDYKIQFNLINTAPFSTLEPNDKELHYFPSNKMHLLKKATDANLCITVMHHSYEWFNWNYKSDLEKNIIDNSEMLFTGHDHREKMSTVSINNSLDTWISAAGQANFSSADSPDSFNIIVIDTDTNTFDGYVFTWNSSNKIYVHKMEVEKKTLHSHTTQLTPLPSYIKSLKEDTYNASDDFTKYFVFPKLIADYKNEFDKYEELKTIESLIKTIEDKKKILISGSTNSGKTTLLKYLFCSLVNDRVPLFVSVDSKTRLKPHNFIKHLFEEQYGDNAIFFEKYQQLEKSKKLLIIDGWDLLDNCHGKSNLMALIEREFEYIIFSESTKRQDMVQSIKDEVSDGNFFCELHIKPFFAEKRNQLVRNICVQRNSYNDEDINNVNKLIDSLVQNNSGLFSLNPAFIIRYTNYFIQDPYRDYAKGEAIFSKIFEYELQQSIINLSKRSDVDEILVALEEIAGYMYTTRKDVLSIENIREIVEQYNREYGVEVNPKTIIEIGTRAKIFKQADDLSIYFYNKNHLAYFVSKYLIRVAQSNTPNTDGIAYALKNICFGINSDIVLFISYLSSNTQTIMSIISQAGGLLSPWEEVKLDKKNISILHSSSQISIEPPSEKELEEYAEKKECCEECQYSEEVVEAKGLFEYDDKDIDEYPYRLIRAIKYTEMLCKALPAFNSSLKLIQKRELVTSIYSYPRKIVYAMLRPIDIHIEEICNDLLTYIEKIDKKKTNGKSYTKDDMRKLFYEYAQGTLLSIFDHFAEICINSKTSSLLLDKDINETSEQIIRLLMIENSGQTDLLLKEAEAIIKKYGNSDIMTMTKLIVRKHLLCNPELSYQKKQQVVDKIFGQQARKTLLFPAQ